MYDTLFIPLNTNHVQILGNIIKNINTNWIFLSHDKIADDKKYHTSHLLKKKGLKFIEFECKIERSEKDHIIKKIISYFKIRNQITKVLLNIKPKVIVLSIDNDPISTLFLKEAKVFGIKSVIIQEGSDRPDLKRNIKGLKNWIVELLRIGGIQIGYIPHGMSCLFDIYCVSGKNAKRTLENRGVPSRKIKITGQPKYDEFISMANGFLFKNKKNKRLLFAAGFNVIADKANRDFLKELILSTMRLEFKLIIKLHPRSEVNPSDIEQLYPEEILSHCKVIKSGDSTLDTLRHVYGIITVASTVITEALILNREGILVDYLANEMKLPLSGYDAVFHIDCIGQVHDIIERSYSHQKPFENKKIMLKDNLFILDGNASSRVAQIIESLIE